MAYRGDTDPLENIIQRQRTTRRIVLALAILWLLPNLLRMDWMGLRAIYTAPAVVTDSRSVAAEPVAPGSKMTPRALELLLARSASTRAPVDLSCTPGQNGWDFVCRYRPSPGSPAYLKIGVQVNTTSIVQASAPTRFEHPLAGPPHRR